MKEAEAYQHFAKIDDLSIKAFAPLFLIRISYSVKDQKTVIYFEPTTAKMAPSSLRASGQKIVFIELVGRVSKKRIGSLERAA